MHLDEILQTRRSVRNYKNIPVGKDEWTAIVEAGCLAPSSGNIQNWHVIVIEKKDSIRKIAHMCYNQIWMSQAPILLIVCANEKIANQFYQTRGERLYSIQNCAAMTQNMILKATELGLATCWVGAFDEERLSVHLGLPKSVRPQAILTVGVANEEVPKPAQKKIQEVAFYETFGNIYSVYGKALASKSYSLIRVNWFERTKKLFEDIFQKLTK